MKYRVLFPGQVDGAQSALARVPVDLSRPALSGADLDGCWYVVATRFPFEGRAPATDLFDSEEQAARAIAVLRKRCAYAAPEVLGNLTGRLASAVIQAVDDAVE